MNVDFNTLTVRHQMSVKSQTSLEKISSISLSIDIMKRKTSSSLSIENEEKEEKEKMKNSSKVKKEMKKKMISISKVKKNKRASKNARSKDYFASSNIIFVNAAVYNLLSK